MKREDVERLWPNGQNLLYGIAKRAAPSRPELWEDLVQEGWLRIVLSKHTPTSNPDSYYRHVAYNGMVSYLRRERPNGAVVTFSRAKRLGLLHCPSCHSSQICWTVFWPSLVRCLDCAEHFNVEDPVGADFDVEDVLHVWRHRHR